MAWKRVFRQGASAIRNLIDNALIYGHQADLELSTQGDQAIITIRDQGPGIPDEQLDLVTGPFYRSDKVRTVNKAGHGLGLAICKNYIQHHKGQLRLENMAAGGLAARITLPIYLGTS